MTSSPAILPGASVLPALDGPGTDRPAPKRHEGADGKSKRRHGDRFAVLNGFVDCSMGDLSRAEALTWLVLYRDTRNGIARTGQTDIARRIGTSRRTVNEAIRGLRGRKLVSLVHQGGLNRGTSIYRVHPLAREPTNVRS